MQPGPYLLRIIAAQERYVVLLVRLLATGANRFKETTARTLLRVWKGRANQRPLTTFFTRAFFALPMRTFSSGWTSVLLEGAWTMAVEEMTPALETRW